MSSLTRLRQSCSSRYSEQLSDSLYDYSSHDDDLNPESEVFYITGEGSLPRSRMTSVPSFGVITPPRRIRVSARQRDSRRSGISTTRPKDCAPASDSSLISGDSGLSSHSEFSNPPVPDRSSRIRSGFAPVRESAKLSDDLDYSEQDDNAPVYENCRRAVDYTSIYGNLIIDTFYELLRGGSLGIQKIDYGRKKIRMSLRFTASLELTQDDMLNRERIKAFAKCVERRLLVLRTSCLLEFRRGCDDICSIINRIKHLEEEDLNKTLSSRFTRGIRRVFTINRK